MLSASTVGLDFFWRFDADQVQLQRNWNMLYNHDGFFKDPQVTPWRTSKVQPLLF